MIGNLPYSSNCSGVYLTVRVVVQYILFYTSTKNRISNEFIERSDTESHDWRLSDRHFYSTMRRSLNSWLHFISLNHSSVERSHRDIRFQQTSQKWSDHLSFIFGDETQTRLLLSNLKPHHTIDSSVDHHRITIGSLLEKYGKGERSVTSL